MSKKLENEVLEGKVQIKEGVFQKPYNLRVVDGFAGFGGSSFGLELAEIPHEVVGFMEINKYAIQCYKQNHPGIKNYGDINDIEPNDLPDFDLFTGGFPCQDVSIAGKRDLSNGRTILFDEIIRIAEVKKPKYMLLENVKGLLSMKDFWQHVKSELNRIGYSIRYKVLNSKDYGIPQNRERIWILCSINGFEPFKELFPRKEQLNLFIKDILEEDVDEKYFLNKKQIKRLKEKVDEEGTGIVDLYNNTLNKDIAPTLTLPHHNNHRIQIHSTQPRSGDPTKGGTGPLNRSDGLTYCLDTGNTQCIEIIGSMQDNAGNMKDISPGLTSAMGSGGGQIPIIKNYWRRLTPKECFRLMGFKDNKINLKELSDTQCYKLAGNGWDVNLVSKIFKTWLKKGE